jgi:hypothetical protein
VFHKPHCASLQTLGASGGNSARQCMDKKNIDFQLTKFLDNFDCLTKDKYLTRPDWQINELIKSYADKNLGDILTYSTEDKINWLIRHDNHPFKKNVIALKKAVIDKLEDDLISRQIDNLCNGKFLDSVGVPGQSIYFDIIEDLCAILQKK